MTMKQTDQRQVVGENIRRARKAAGLSHDTLGAMVGTSRQHLIRLEQGKHMPGTELLERIAEATGTAASELCPDEDEEEAAVMDDPLDLAADLVRMFDRRYGFMKVRDAA